MSSCAPGVPSLFGKSGGEPVGSRSCSVHSSGWMGESHKRKIAHHVKLIVTENDRQMQNQRCNIVMAHAHGRPGSGTA